MQASLAITSVVAPNITNIGSRVHPLAPDEQVNPRHSAILNEAAHVFDWHAVGLWKSEYKDAFDRLLVPDVKQHPKPIQSIPIFNDCASSMVVIAPLNLQRKTRMTNQYLPPVAHSRKFSAPIDLPDNEELFPHCHTALALLSHSVLSASPIKPPLIARVTSPMLS